MKVSELKKELDRIYNTLGDINVCIKNSDDCGEYYGYCRDAEYLDIEDNSTGKSLIIA